MGMPKIRPLFSREQIAARTRELGEEITRDYREIGGELLVVGLLNGTFIFMADLVREIDLVMKLGFMAVSSYGDRLESSGSIRIQQDLDIPVLGRQVLLVEDILDTGRTFSVVADLLRSRGAAAVRTCALLDKVSRRVVPIRLDYRGFEIPDLFVVGSGLDYLQEYRNLPYIGVLEEARG